MYAKEQKVKQEGSGTEAGGLRVLRGKRAAAGGEGAAAAASVRRKDVFARSNRGVEDRLQRDELERVTQSKKKKTAERTLAVKAKLYEKMGKMCQDPSAVLNFEELLAA